MLSLSDEKMFLEQVFESAHVAMCVTDANGHLWRTNKAYRNLVGYQSEELLGNLITMLVPPEETASVQEYYNIIATGGPSLPKETRLLCKNGDIKDVSLESERFYDGERYVVVTVTGFEKKTYHDEQTGKVSKRERYLEALVQIQRLLLKSGLDKALYTEILRLIGTAANATRAYVFENKHDKTGRLLMCQVAEWCAEGISPRIKKSRPQNLPYEPDFTEWIAVLSRGEFISGQPSRFSRLSQADPESGENHAFLILPLIVKERFFGFVGLEGSEGCIADVLSEVALFQVVASAISFDHERYWAQDALRQAKDHLQAVLDAVPGYVSWISRDLRYLGVNERLVAALDMTREQFLDVKVGELNTDFGRFVRDFFESEATSRSMELSSKLEGKQGSQLLVAQKYNQGKAAVFVGIDISEQKKTEQTLRDHARLLDVTRDAMIVIDASGKIVFWNNGAERLYGWTAAKALGMFARQLLYDEANQYRYDEAYHHVLQSGDWSGELSQKNKDDKQFTVESRWVPIRDGREVDPRILIVNTDITERKQLQSQLLRNQRMDGIGMLASGIAHDMNNVLTPILAGLDMIRRTATDEKSKRRLRLMEVSAQRGKELIRQILAFGRGAEGEKSAFNVRPLLEDIHKLMDQTFPKNIDLKLSISREVWTGYGNAAHLHHVLMNLCLNARDAMPSGGTLSITAENFWVDQSYARMNVDAKVGRHLRIIVSDTGVGIEPENLDKIFEPFFTTKKGGSGTGLGLSQVFSIIRSNNGFIEVKSKIGEGSVFKLYIPAAVTETSQEEEDRAAPEVVGSGELILVVDDEASIREVTSELLQMAGYKVIEASNGAEAVALYSKHGHEIKLVILDMMMPVMDGVACAHALRTLTPSVKLIAMSGVMDTRESKKLHEAGVQASVPKPFTAENMLAVVNRLISQPPTQ
ncbi:MAG: PAS domain S-box protein [Chlorobiales bacterium]|nr:PAS domain S-box protein [Chlorobiales bacterium]